MPFWSKIGGGLIVRGPVQIGPGGEMRSVVAVATNAQMLALLGTDKTIVPAPGAGYAAILDELYMYFDSGGAYTIGTADLRVSYAGDTDIMTLTEAGFLDQATDQQRVQAPAAVYTPVTNAAIVLRAVTADLTGGNAANSLTLISHYRVVKIGAGVASF